MRCAPLSVDSVVSVLSLSFFPEALLPDICAPACAMTRKAHETSLARLPDAVVTLINYSLTCCAVCSALLCHALCACLRLIGHGGRCRGALWRKKTEDRLGRWWSLRLMMPCNRRGRSWRRMSRDDVALVTLHEQLLADRRPGLLLIVVTKDDSAVVCRRNESCWSPLVCLFGELTQPILAGSALSKTLDMPFVPA